MNITNENYQIKQKRLTVIEENHPSDFYASLDGIDKIIGRF